MALTEQEAISFLASVIIRHPRWWADPHWRLHRRYGWTPRKARQ